MSTHSVREYGAVGDGETTDTGAIQDAIDACADASGGTVRIPAGEYVTGPLFLRSDVRFHVEAGATLLGRRRITDYPTVEGRWNGIELEVYASLLTGHDLQNVSITGRGTIDARGAPWWEAVSHDHDVFDERGVDRMDCFPPPAETILDHPRPNAIHLQRCSDVLVRDVQIRNSPFWAVHPTYCENVTIDNVTVRNPADSPNTDGINPDSCRNVRIANCHIDVGDDCVTIKSGFDEDGRRVGKPCENVVISNCTMERGHGGVVIGSEMSGDVRNVTVTNCVFDGTDNGLRIKTERGRGGIVENVRATNLVMNDLRNTAFIVNMYYHGSDAGSFEVTEETPRLRDIHYSDVTVSGTTTVAAIRGLEEMPVRNVSLTDVRANGAEEGIYVQRADDVYVRNVVLDVAGGPAVSIEDATAVELERVVDRTGSRHTPPIHVEGSEVIVRSRVSDTSDAESLERDEESDVVLVDDRSGEGDEPVGR